ncbi:MAG TPA: S8 family serine peptidase [Candidatus Deferrimicrobium sp.]|nr:S8 family serine peptidase [Candidatus Deferrimicrobium sp.]
MKLPRLLASIAVAIGIAAIVTSESAALGAAQPLRREIAPKPVYTALPNYLNSDQVIFKLTEDIGQPALLAGQFVMSGAEWDRLNFAIAPSKGLARKTQRHFTADAATLHRLRERGSQRIGRSLPDLSLYYEIDIAPGTTAAQKLSLIDELNSLGIIEIAYFPAVPKLPIAATPNWEASQNYLQAAPEGIDAYYAWGAPGGKGQGIKVVDIEGNWVESHEDLHGGTDHFHIAGGKIVDPGWYHHGTAVLGEIAADSNTFGMTGIAFNVELGTVSIGSMSIANAINTAVTNSDTGDIILIELQIGGPNNGEYVPVEYEQASFDAILLASANNRIVVEAGANGAQDLDDPYWYGQLFNPSVRFSGAIMVAASDGGHYPAGFTSHGQRLDVHAYGTWDVYTLGYGDLYGTDTTDFYTGTFAGTSSASPIIVGACACLQGINKAIHATVLDHSEMRTLLQTYSTPQSPSSWLIGPMPDLQGSVDQVVGVAFYADTTVGWVPLPVNFTASSGLQVDTWTWDFGDGDSAFVQSPSHTYEDPGLYSVTLQIDAGGDIRSAEKSNYVIALGDSLIALDTAGARGTSVVATIYARNSVPMREIRIPVLYAGSLNLSINSFSTAGCRTSYFEQQSYSHYDPSNKKVTVKLVSSTSGTSPDLAPGTGPILKLNFNIPSSAADSQTALIVVSGYDAREPVFSGFGLTYEPVATTGTISVCSQRGNVDGLPGITVADITFMVDYMFNNGPAPLPLESGDYNCANGINIEDLTSMVAFLFAFGPPPCSC